MSSDAGTSPAGRRSILFIGEAVTLAHVARPVTLARGLDAGDYAVTLACDPRNHDFLAGEEFAVTAVRSISSEQFLQRLAKGEPLYDVDTLRDYVRQDLGLFNQTTPDLVVGDFRLSLSVSARLAGIPYITLSNAYWSPYARQRFPLPELPITRLLGVTLASVAFRLVRPLAFAWHTRPLNRIRREFGLPGLGLDLRRSYTDADFTLYSDIPELLPTFDLPDTHDYLGALLWSPPCGLPDWWDRLPAGRPVIYVTLGSSGDTGVLPLILQALAELPVTLIVATAGRLAAARDWSDNVFVSDYLPGVQAAARAALVICNGGSLTAQQALVAGVPVMGIVSNMDQHMNMQSICNAGAGGLLRQGAVTAETVFTLAETLLADGRYTTAARRLAVLFSNYNAKARFQAVVNRALGRDTAA